MTAVAKPIPRHPLRKARRRRPRPTSRSTTDSTATTSTPSKAARSSSLMTEAQTSWISATRPQRLILSWMTTGGTGTGSSFTFTGSFEVIVLTPFDDHYTGATSVGTNIRALDGDDVIDLSASIGTDTIDGGPGDDVMIGGTGNTTFVETPNSADVIIDSGGMDTIDFSGASLGVKFNLSLDTGQAQNLDSASNTVAVTGTLEIVIGSEHDDDLSGNSFNNVLVGLAGDDRLSGHSGRDVLIGGTGSDRLIGGTGDDILIAGWTTYDRNDAALRAILAEWSTGLLEDRVENLRNGSVTLADGTPIVLLKASTVEFDATVFDDLDPDQITGSNGPDWLFFDDLLDVVTDENPNVDVINDGPVPGVRAAGRIESTAMAPFDDGLCHVERRTHLTRHAFAVPHRAQRRDGAGEGAGLGPALHG